MFILHTELRGLTASFRVPHMFKYHRSLPLPPYTSIVGIFGAAIGKDMATAQELFKSFNLKVGIAGGYSGECNDTWRVLTTKNSENDVVERQMLFRPRYHILFCGDQSSVCLCERIFRYPVYPVSLGRPDDLANVIVHGVSEGEPEALKVLHNTVVVGIPSATVDNSLFDINDPTDPGPCTSLYRLPVSFRFADGFSYDRIADDFRDFTFIGNHKITVNFITDIARDSVPYQPYGFVVDSFTGKDKEKIHIPILEI